MDFIVCKLYTQSGPQDQKSVIFSHNIISLNQLLRNSKNSANIFLMSKYFILGILCIIFKALYAVNI